MKLFKRCIIIFIFIASAIILSNIGNESSCVCGAAGFPFSLLNKIFNNSHETNSVNHAENSGYLSLFGTAAYAQQNNSNIKVTFIELGSVNCIPCKMMQPVMKEIEQKYGKQVKVVFHDVWTKKGEPFASQYGIKAIPTQVFLDSNGKEYFRHLGYFPFEEVEKILKQGGVR
jgi:thioredoxin 1